MKLMKYQITVFDPNCGDTWPTACEMALELTMDSGDHFCHND